MADRFVFIEDDLGLFAAARYGHRGYLGVEPAVGLCCGGLLVALGGELVKLFAGDIVLLRQVLGGETHGDVGDGVVAFFPVEVFDSESAAATACISAARNIAAAMPEVASRCELPAEQLIMRFGLHWGSTIYMGNIGTVARSEVTALGDEVNEAARIEACATGGRILASKPLVERLSDDDAANMNIDLDTVTYKPLAALDTSTDKARRDAPAIAVCEL